MCMKGVIMVNTPNATSLLLHFNLPWASLQDWRLLACLSRSLVHSLEGKQCAMLDGLLRSFWQQVLMWGQLWAHG